MEDSWAFIKDLNMRRQSKWCFFLGKRSNWQHLKNPKCMCSILLLYKWNCIKKKKKGLNATTAKLVCSAVVIHAHYGRGPRINKLEGQQLDLQGVNLPISQTKHNGGQKKVKWVEMGNVYRILYFTFYCKIYVPAVCMACPRRIHTIFGHHRSKLKASEILLSRYCKTKQRVCVRYS